MLSQVSYRTNGPFLLNPKKVRVVEAGIGYGDRPWQEELESGEYSSIEESASAKKIDVSYVRRMLRLNSLAPDIVVAILAGDDRTGLSLRQLRRGFPLLWAEQRELWA